MVFGHRPHRLFLPDGFLGSFAEPLGPFGLAGQARIRARPTNFFPPTDPQRGVGIIAT